MYNGVYPAYIKPYTQVKQKTVQRKGEEEQTGSSSENREQQSQNRNSLPLRANNYQLAGYRNFQSQIKARQGINTYGANQGIQPQNNVQGTKTINVSQIITDFKGTTNAVGAPKEVMEEVNAYLDLIQAQAEKDVPNKKIIQSNLRNASQVLDGYISQTLKTQSNVVENWVDALFMQQVDYKANPEAINPELKLNFVDEENPVENKPVTETETVLQAQAGEKEVLQEEEVSKHYVPQDRKMKNLFIRAKKSAGSEDKISALIALKQALNYAEKTDDIKMQSMLYFETADLYNKNGDYSKALKGYKIAADMSEDGNLIAKSYMKTGKIYDKAGLVESAQKHWVSAIGYAGEADNIKLQVKALTNLAETEGELYHKQSAYNFVNLANNMAEVTQDEKIKGYAFKKSSKVYEQFNDNPKALQYLKASSKSYKKANDDNNLIDNFISAADIMLNAGNSAKAKSLLNKAFLTAVDAENQEAVSLISRKIAKLSV